MNNPLKNQEPENNGIDWEEFEKLLGEEPEEKSLEDQTIEFDRVVTPVLKKIYRYCKRNNIPFIAAFAMLKEEAEEEDHDTSISRQLAHLPLDTKNVICELMACSIIFEMPHEFSHMVMALSQTWRMMGAKREDMENIEDPTNWEDEE